MSWLRAYVFCIADRPCAFWICNLYRAVLYSCFLGFDPAYARYSPGAYLMLEVINRLSQEGAVSRSSKSTLVSVRRNTRRDLATDRVK
jgi:ribosomal protein S18 acetylase RimI-like enzyme